MKSFTYVITDPVGIHARPAGNLVKEVKKYNCADGIELENKYSFTYNKKGKLNKIIKR